MAVLDPVIVPAREAERLEAVHRYDILDTPPDGAFDRITALAARVFQVPIAIVSIVDHDRIWFKSRHGLEIEQIGRDPGLCASAIMQHEPWVISDAPADPRALTNPLVAGEFGLKFYAGVPLRTSDGHNLGTLCILDFAPREMTPHETRTLEDLGAMVLSELELRLASRRALSEADERDRLKDAFMGMLSHELRTPVTTIYAAAQMLARTPTLLADARAQELLPDITSESERLLRMIENLLVLTRVEQGSLEPTTEPVMLQRTMPQLVEHELRRWSGRTVDVDIDPGLPPIAGDPTYLEQVVSNLLSNALKYSAPTAPVEITAIEVGDDVEVRVRDHGIGLPASERESVFELLFRSDRAERYAPGAGIGLYVCRRLLQAMGGHITAEPADGVGTVFAFRLPVASA